MIKYIMIIVRVILLMVLIPFVWEIIYFKTNLKKEVYILPHGFKGIVLIAYNQADGLEDIREDDKLIYRIPPNGVLRLKRKEPKNLTQTCYLYHDSQGKRTELPYSIAPGDDMTKNPDKVFVFKKTNGGFENAGEELEMTTFLIGTLNDSDSLNKADEKFNPLELLKSSR